MGKCELRTCPFCGFDAELRHLEKLDDSSAPRPHHAYRVECRGCEVALEEISPRWWSGEAPEENEEDLAARERVILRWNTRDEDY